MMNEPLHVNDTPETDEETSVPSPLDEAVAELESREIENEPETENSSVTENEPVIESETTNDSSPVEELVNTVAPVAEAVIAEVAARFDSLESLFKKRMAYDEGKEKIIDKLHSELQSHKSDLYLKLTRPIYNDIIIVLDDIRKMKESLDKETQNESDSLLDYVSESLICVLDKYEVLPFTSEVNSKFNAVLQRMVRTKETDDDSKVSMIAESIFDGFMYKDQLISPEKVVVYKKTTIVEEQ